MSITIQLPKEVELPNGSVIKEITLRSEATIGDLVRAGDAKNEIELAVNLASVLAGVDRMVLHAQPMSFSARLGELIETIRGTDELGNDQATGD